MKNKLFKMVSLFMVVVMLTSIIPVGTYANETEEVISESFSEIEEKEIEIECEVESKRTENSKTFLTSDGFLYQVSAAVPIHKKVKGVWKDVDDVDESSVKNAEDASALISDLAKNVEQNEQTRSSDSEDLEILCNGGYSPIKIAGANLNSGIKSCVYVKPTINTDKAVFIASSSLSIQSIDVDDDDDTNSFSVYRLVNELNSVGNSVLPYHQNVLFDTKVISENEIQYVDITSYLRYTSLGIYANTGLAFVPNYNNTYIEVEDESMTLSVLYRELGEIDGKFESESVNLGRAGTMYINDYSCNPIIVRNDLSVFDELESVNIQTIINPSAIDEYDNDGTNTRINYYSTLQYSSESDEYYWKNCEGNYIYFVHETNYSYKGYDNSGYTYLLIRGNNATNFANIIITSDKDDYTYSFETYEGKGYVNEIEDKYGNTIQISYTNGVINAVYDGSNRQYLFNYNNSDMLESISVSYLSNSVYSPVTINNEPVVINYEYDNDYRLASVVYPDGYTVVYQYDSNDRLSLIKSYEDENLNVELKELSITYFNYSASSNMVSGYTLKNHGNIAKSVSINSPFNSPLKRIIENETDDIEKIIHYDNNAKMLYCKDYNGEEYYLDYINEETKYLIIDDNNNTNVVNNGDFESGNNNWNVSSYPNVASVVTAPGSLTNHALKISASENNISVNQSITVTKNTQYIVSCSAFCASDLPFNDDRYYSISVNNGSSILDEYYFDGTQTNDWQSYKFVISVPNTTSIKVSLNCKGLSESCYFDNVKIYKAVGNALDVSEDSGSLYEIFRNSNGTIKDITRVGTSSSFLGKHYEYDENTYISSILDEGKTTYYNYDGDNGLLYSKGKNSNSSDNTSYTYSAIGALNTVQQVITNLNEANPTTQQTSFSYDDDLIKSVTHNGYTYNYEYNNKNQITGIKVSETINNEEETYYSVSYEYDDEQIGTVEFGNGGTITYEYDGDKITSVVYDNRETGNDRQVFEYEYEYKGNKIYRIIDHVANTITTFNDNGCVVTKNNNTIFSNTGNSINLFNKSMAYSKSNSTSNNSNTLTEKFTVSLLSGPIVDLETTTDSLKRLKSTEITNRGSWDRDTHYRMTTNTNYVPGQNGRETTLVKSFSSNISKRNNIGSQYGKTRLTREWNYKYDNVGRVTSVFRKYSSNITASGSNPGSYSYNEGNLAYYYQYDKGGEISLELDFVNNVANKYAYDAGGNLKSKTEYSIDSNNYT